MSPNNMLAQIKSLPELIRSEIDRLDRNVRLVLNHNEILSTKRILITGCGDSYFSGMAAELAFESLTGLPVEPLTAMNAARYSLPYTPKEFPLNPLVFGVSISGGVARTVEAMKAAKQQEAFTVAITGNPDSPLAQNVDRVVDCSLPSFVDSPGVRSYRGSLMVLYLFAIRFAEVSGRISQDEGAKLRGQLKTTADAIEATIAACEDTAAKLAKECVSNHDFVFIGDGPNLATAHFSAAKVIEATGYNACGQDTEEWAHLQYFNHQSQETPTFVISPCYRGYGRVTELMEPMRRVGRKIIAVVPENEKSVTSQADSVLPVVGEIPEIFTPMVYAIPGELFASKLAEVANIAYFRTDQSSYQIGDNTIRSSRVVDISEL